MIANELIGSTAKTGGEVSSRKVHTLKNGTVYVMQFVNVDNQVSAMHMNLGWSENDPEPFRLISPVDPAS